MAPTAPQRAHAPTPQGKNQIVAAAAHPEITGLLESPIPKMGGGKTFEIDNPEVSPEVQTVEFDKSLVMQDDEEEDTSAVQLRGLPFRATVEDVQMFLREHAKKLKDENSIRLLLNRHGRPSGFARVQFNTQQEAQACRDALHTAPMDDRYVEVFIYSEWPKRTRSKKAPSMTDHGLLNGDGELGADVPCATKQEVLMECREGLRQQGANSMVLLSTLGALLSPEGRAFLRRTDQGLKHFLGQYPEEFIVEGAKGCEAVGLKAVVSLHEQLGHSKPHAMPKQVQNFSSPQHNQQQHQDKHQQQEELTPPKSKPGDKDGTVAYLRSWADPETLSAWKEMNMPRTPIPGERERMLMSDLAPVPEDVPVSPPPSCNRSNPQPFGTPSDWGTPKPFPSPGRKSGSLAAQTANQANPQNADLYGRLSKQGAFNGMPGMCDMSALGAWPGDMSAMYPGGLAGQPPMWPAAWPANFGWGAGGFGGPFPGGFPGPAGTGPAGGMGACPPCPGTPEKMPNPAAFMHMMTMMSSPESLGLPNPKMLEEDQNAVAEVLTMNLAADLRLNETDIGYQAAVRLRGLPFEASEQDILTLFSTHNIVDRVEDTANAVQLLKKPNGKPSGQAVVQLRGRGDAQIAQSVLHGKWMGTRYVEVFACDAGSDGRRLESGPDSVMSPPQGAGLGAGALGGNRRNQGQNSRGPGMPNKDQRSRNGQQGYPRPPVCESI